MLTSPNSGSTSAQGQGLAHEDLAPDRVKRPSYRFVALIIASAMFMEHMDGTVLNTALPAIARDFDIGVTSLSAALTAYLLALALFIPASGRLTDRFGSRTMFQVSIVVFLAGSLLSAQAGTLPILVAARFLQGIGGAVMIPVGRMVLLRSVDKRDIVDAMSWLLMPAMIGPIVGPPLGGFIVTYLNWRWIFYLNIPIGLLGLFLVSRYIIQVRGQDRVPFDTRGFILSGVCLSSLIFGFETAGQSGDFRISLSLLATGLLTGVLYVRHARGFRHPLLDLTLLRISTFRLSMISGSLTRITQGAQPFLLPLMLQTGFGMTAAASGLITLASAVGALTMKALAPIILRRFGFRNALVLNGLAASGLYAICGFFRPGWPVPVIFCVLAVAGFAMSLQFTGYNTIAYDEVPSERISNATSFYATFQQLMLSVGICTGAAVLHASTLVAHQPRPTLDQFTVTFLTITAISALGTIWTRQFAPSAGDKMAGRATAH